MELRHLVALEAVAAERSFSAAAAKLGYTQSAVSGQILALERVVGARLIERIRGARPISLTAEGEVLLRHATAINGRLDLARAEIAALRDGAGVLRVGVHQSVSRAIVPETLRRLAVDDPEADVALSELFDVRGLLDMLERGKIDLALTALPVREGPFTVVPIYRDEHVLVVRASDPLASRGEISLAELGELDLIAINDCRTQSAAEDALAAEGTPLKVTRRLEDTKSILAFVSAGLGIGFLPALSAELPEELAAVRLPGVVAPRVIAIVQHSELEPSTRARRFVDVAVGVGRSLAAKPALAAAV